ncbi:MAG: leucine-rich repeat domain-containing protein, partial [Propionibacteriaceae bacterium]|nr:leucine-rich repeat domain-containing protein [Propionibacteriaceae bacterium]
MAGTSAFALLFGLTMPSNVAVADDTDWQATDFAVTGGEVTGFTDAGKAKWDVAADKALTVVGTSASKIADTAFINLGIEKLTLTTGYTEIGAQAFRDNKISELDLENVTKVGADAFGNNRLTDLTADNLEEIGSKAFANNQLRQVTLDALTTIDPQAFDGNGKVVQVLTSSTAVDGSDSSYTAGSGFVINPTQVTVHFVDDASPPNAVQADKTYGDDFSTADLYSVGDTVSFNAPDVSGYRVIPPASQSITLAASGNEVTFSYEEMTGSPVIYAIDHVVANGAVVDEAELKSWATAEDAWGTPIPASSIKVQPTSVNTTTAHTETVTYEATDAYGNTAVKSITVRVGASPMDECIDSAQTAPNCWTYNDFEYASRTETVSVTKYPTGDYTESVTGLAVIGLSNAGKTKMTASGTPAAVKSTLVLPGLHPVQNKPVVAISSAGTNKFSSMLTSTQMSNLDLSHMTDLEIVGNQAFATTSTNTSAAYGSINFGAAGARLTKLRAIGDNAFAWNKVVNLDLSGLTALTILADFAFSDGSGNTTANTGGHALQSIDFSNLPNLLVIGDKEGAGGRAFINSQLRSLDLSGAPNLEQLGIAAFCGAGSGSINIAPFPVDLSMLDKLKIIGQFAFRDYPISNLNISGMDSLERIDGNNFGHVGGTVFEIKDDPKLTAINPEVFLQSTPARLPLTISGITELVIDNNDSLVTLHRTGTGTNGIATTAGGFDDFTNLTTLTITNNDSLPTIEAVYFQTYTTLTTITIANNDALATIPYRAFTNAPVTTLTIADNDALTTIGQEAFMRNRLTSLDLSTNPMLTTIGINAFSQNNQGNPANTSTIGGNDLTSLNLSGLTHLETIGNEAFANAQLTGTFDFSTNTALKYIGTRAFRSSPITGIVLPQSIEMISIMAFGHYDSDTLVLEDLPNLKILAAGSFGQSGTEYSTAPLKYLELRNLPALVNLNRPGTEYTGTPVVAGDYNTDMVVETAYCVGPGADGILGTSDDTTQGAVAGVFGAGLVNLETLVIDNVGLVGIPTRAFFRSPLTSLTIANMPNLKKIGVYGDKNPDGTNISGVTNDGPFEAARLTELTLDNLPLLETIGNEAFVNSPLQSLTLTNLPQLKEIGERAFQNATALTELDLSNLPSLEIIGDNAFELAPIASLDLSGDTSLRLIAYRAFYSNRLTTVDFSDLSALEIIGSRAFSDGSAPGSGGGGSLITKVILKNNTSLRIIGSVDGGNLGDAYKANTYNLCGEGGRTFYGARLTELDLSEAPNLESVGFAAFLNSPLESLDFTGLNKLQYIGMLSFAAYQGTELTIKDLPELYEIGGLAFSAGRTNTNLTSLTLENLPKLTYIAEQQAFKADANGVYTNLVQGYNTTHVGPPYPQDTANTAKKAYEKLTNLVLSDLPLLNNIPPYIFFASPLTSVQLSGLDSLTAIGDSAFYKAQLTELSLDNLSALADIGYRAFYSSPITTLSTGGLTSLRTIEAEAFHSAKVDHLDLSDTNGFLGFPFWIDQSYGIHKGAFGTAGLRYVLLGGIGAENGSDQLYWGSWSEAAGTCDANSWCIPVFTQENDSAELNANQTFNGNTSVPVYTLNGSQAVVTQDGYQMNPAKILVHPVERTAGDDGILNTGDDVLVPIGKDRVITVTEAPKTGITITPPRITGYLQHLDITGVDVPANPDPPDGYSLEMTIEYDRDPYGTSIGFDIHQPLNGTHTYDLIGQTLVSKLYIDATGTGGVLPAGSYFEIYYDPTRVQWQTQVISGFTMVDNPGTGVLRMTLTTPINPGSPFTYPLTWKLIPGPTEEGREFPIAITLYDQNGDPIMDTPETTYLSGYYSTPAPIKSIWIDNDGNQRINEATEWISADGNNLNVGAYDDAEHEYKNTDNLKAVYRIKVTKLSRNIREITYTDTLPSYEAYDPGGDVTKIATFDPAENDPCWTVAEFIDHDNDDSTPYDPDLDIATKLSCTYTGLATMNPPAAPDLVVRFPDAVPNQQIVNNSDYTALLHQPAGSEVTYDDNGVLTWEKTLTGSDAISVLLTADPPGNMVKKPYWPHNGAVTDVDGDVIYGKWGWFLDTSAEKNGEMAWNIGVSGKDGNGNLLPAGDYFRDFIYEDHDLDPRMQYVGVSLGYSSAAFGKVTVTAYDAAGTVLYQVNNTSGTDDVMPAGQSAQAFNKSVVRFPAAIQPNIAKVTLSAPSLKVYSGDNVTWYLITKLRNPGAKENSYEWLHSNDPAAATDPAYNNNPSLLSDGDRLHYNTQRASGSYTTYGPVFTIGDDYYFNSCDLTARTLVHYENGQQQLSQQLGVSTAFMQIHNVSEAVGLTKTSTRGTGPFGTGAALGYQLKLDTYDVPLGSTGVVTGTGNYTPITATGLDTVFHNWEVIDVIPEGFTPYTDTEYPARKTATTNDDLFIPSALLKAATVDPANPAAGSTLKITYEADAYEVTPCVDNTLPTPDGDCDDPEDTPAVTRDILRIHADYLALNLLNDPNNTNPANSGILGTLNGTVASDFTDGTVTNKAYMSYADDPGVVKVDKQSLN